MTAPAPVRVLVATDLDRTLVFSPQRAALGGALPDTVVEVLDGRVISTMALEVRERLAALAAVPGVELLPATTRTHAQFDRVDLGVAVRWAVVASGAVVLRDGRPDPEWQRRTAARLAESSAPVAAVRDLVAGWTGRPWLLRVRDADDVFLVAAVDADSLDADELGAVQLDLEPRGWRAVHQGRKLYVLPSGLHKAHAVDYVRARLTEPSAEPPLLLAAGDTLLDWEMLLAADRGWLPAGSELALTGATAPHVTQTADVGHAASAEIVSAWQRAAEQALAGRPRAGGRPVATGVADRPAGASGSMRA